MLTYSLLLALGGCAAPSDPSPAGEGLNGEMEPVRETLLEAALVSALSAGRSTVYWTDGRAVTRIEDTGLTHATALEPADLQSAGMLEGVELVAGTDTAWIWANELVVFDLGIASPLQQIRSDDAQAWFRNDAGWTRRKGGLLAHLQMSGTPTACVAVGLREGVEVAWVGTDAQISAVVTDGTGRVVETAALGAACDGVGITPTGDVVVAAGGALHRRFPAPLGWQEVPLGDPVWSLHAPLGPGDVWLENPLRLVTATGVVGVTTPLERVHGADAAGRLLIQDGNALVRLTAHPSAWFAGVAAGERIEVPTGITLHTTAWRGEPTLAVALVAGSDEVTVPLAGDTAMVDPLSVTPGAWTLRGTARWDDGSVATTTLGLEVPGAPVSFANDVWPLHETRCAFCHFDGGQPGLWSYDDWVEDFPNILEQVEIGAMPLGGPVLAADELTLLRGWQAGGFLP